MRHIVIGLFALLLAWPAFALESPLRKLDTLDDGRDWTAVGKLNIGNRGFCTGALIAPDLVLTAAHCLFDKDTGQRVDTAGIEFLAGWRHGAAAASRMASRAVVHPGYVYGDDVGIGRVASDIALIELDRPVQISSIVPFETDARPSTGDKVGIVSYAKDREDAPSLQETCHVLDRRSDILVLSCSVDFGASGSPIFSVRDGVARVVSVVSAKADVNGQPVAFATSLEGPLKVLRAELAKAYIPSGAERMQTASGIAGMGAKFVKAPLP